MQIPILKGEYPGLKRSQYLEMIHKNVRLFDGFS